MALPVHAYYRLWLFQEFEVPVFHDSQHKKVASCQPYAPAAFTSQEIFLVLISVEG
jgi:hypothetical protein